LQEADITRHAPEAACWLWLGCCRNNDANSPPSPGAFNRRVLRSCLGVAVLIPALSTLVSTTPLQIVTGCLHPTPVDILAGIQPAELHCNGATLFPARHAMEPRHLLHSELTHPLSANARRLKLRHPFVPATQQLICLSDNIRAAQWADHQWNAE